MLSSPWRVHFLFCYYKKIRLEKNDFDDDQLFCCCSKSGLLRIGFALNFLNFCPLIMKFLGHFYLIFKLNLKRVYGCSDPDGLHLLCFMVRDMGSQRILR